MRDDHLHGNEPITPSSYKPAPIKSTPIATSGSSAPYSGDMQHSYTHVGITEENSDVVNGTERGIITPKGTGISVVESDGAEIVSINHHSGAGIQVGTDGSVVITSTSRQGLGFNSPNGDVGIGGNVVTIDAKGSVSIKTNGSLTFDVGRDLVLNVGGSIITKTNGISEVNNGSEIKEIVKDRSVIVGGNSRSTIAGDSRDQYSGKVKIETEGDIDVASNSKINVSSADDLTVATGGNFNITGEGDGSLVTGGDSYITSGGETNVKAGGAIKLDGSSVHANPAIDLALWADDADKTNTALALGAGPGGKPGAVGAGSAEPAEVVEAEVMDADDIVDEISSIRKIPDYPNNAKYETEELVSIGLVGHDTSSEYQQAYDQYASKNGGSRTPVYSESNGELSTTSGGSSYNQVENNTVSKDLQYEVPTTDLNVNDRVAGVSLSELTGAPYSHRIPSSKRAEVLRAHATVMQNVIAPLRAAGFNFTITSAYRGNSRNHVTGYTIDLQAPGRVFSQHVAIAEYAARNLPCSQVFLERSGSGYSHVHIRVHPAGSSGNPSLLTCGDPRCSSKVSGIQGEWLKRRGVKG